MWGTLPAGSRQPRRARFIPTHVGNTSEHRRRSRRTPVHPHACGEHGITPGIWVSMGGSSPRMWGTQVTLGGVQDSPRFIPTHVGNTPLTRSGPGRGAVHPHACGEHPTADMTPITRVGSSPRMWGTHGIYSFALDRTRFIPTHVGNTVQQFPAPHMAQVHPHACGEHLEIR